MIPAFISIFYGFIFYFFVIFRTKKIISSFLVFSLIFGLMEFVRGTILTGFPWNLIAYSFSSQIELISIISVIGTYGFNLFCISLFTCPAILILRRSRKDIGICIFFIISVIIFCFYGISFKKEFGNIEKKT